MKRRTIERGPNGIIISWYGFIPVSSIKDKSCYIDQDDEGYSLELYIDGKRVTTIDYIRYKTEIEGVTASDVWNFIFWKCRLFTRRKIYMNNYLRLLPVSDDNDDSFQSTETYSNVYIPNKEYMELNEYL